MQSSDCLGPAGLGLVFEGALRLRVWVSASTGGSCFAGPISWRATHGSFDGWGCWGWYIALAKA